MKKLHGCLALFFLMMVLIVRYSMWETSLYEQSIRHSITYNASDPLLLLNVTATPEIQNARDQFQVLSTDEFSSNLSALNNISYRDVPPLYTWNLLELTNFSYKLPDGEKAIKEAAIAWDTLLKSAEDDVFTDSLNHTNHQKGKKKQCPYSIRRMGASELADDNFLLKIPCGLVQGSSITIIGTPAGIQGNFQIELAGIAVPGEPEPPIILHYNVRLLGDKLTEDPVIVQNTRTSTDDWGSEERCPSDHDDTNIVDGFESCSASVGKYEKPITYVNSDASNVSYPELMISGPQKSFPFRQGYLAIAILRVGDEGIHMTVDGKHATSFAFRANLEPWFVSEVRISGDIKLTSVIATGLPTSEEFKHVVDVQTLKAPPLPANSSIDLLIGIVSTANNFKRRMAVRSTWMQYNAVRSGSVAVRFFVGLHKNPMVNKELWNEACTYGDIQLMPFVDYYSLILWKTIAICIYGTNVAKYVMKTDDDSFVRVDEIISSIMQLNVTRRLLYGRINFDSSPHREPESKWHITHEEWPDEKYPPWAHGPGYVVSRDVAKMVYKKFKEGVLKMFKLEDVAMGVWIAEMKEVSRDVRYVNDERIYVHGCNDGYVVAHYQSPRSMICMWEKLQTTKRALCCKDS